MAMMLLTVLDGGVGVDVEVDVGPTSSVGSLIAALPVPVDGRACYVGQTPLNPRGAVADSPLMPGAVVSVGGPGPPTRSVTGDEVGKLRVVSGLDTGLTVALSPGRHRVARDGTAAVCLRDLDVSRSEHAWIEVAPDGSALVTDDGSTNGTFLDGRRVGGAGVPLTPASTLRIGGDVLQWTPTASGALPMRRAADGWLDFDRAYAAVPEVPQLEVTMPDKGPEQNTATQTTAAVTAGLTVVASVVAAIAFDQPMILLFAGVGAIGFVVARMVDGNQRGKREKEYEDACGRIWSQIQAHLPAEWRVRAQRAPNPDDVVATIIGQRPDLWARRIDSPHGLTLRVGAADQAAAVTVRGEPWPGFVPPTLNGAPASLDLRATGVLGVVGADRDVQDVLRWLLIQLAALRGPDDLRIVVMAAEGRDDLAWTRWLPHLHAGGSAAMSCWIGNDDHTLAARIDELHAILASRKEAKAKAQNTQFDSEIVVVLDGALALRELPGMDVILRQGPSVGIHLICADRRGMNECNGLCEVGTGGLRLTRTRGDNPIVVGPDRINADGAERLARALSPMRDRITFAQAQNALPSRVRLLDLVGIDTPTADDVLRTWDEGEGPQTRVVLGADANGPTYVDLAKQGPHTMLGGATGAGKSILMQTLVTSLLLSNRPDELNLVLVDFKGGSAFLPFENCPHVVSLIRSTGETAADVFDEAAAARVLASVRAEVSRRESMLARYNGEIDDYWRRRRTEPDLPPLPRLVMVFDEFARVLETSPDFLKELVNVAAKGRSLGMHLVLGTQSLQGKLSAELKNNISLRISLRQNEAADSSEVLGVPDAATIPGSLRGRGMIMCTTAESRRPETFQCGYLGDPPPSGANTAPATVRAVDWTGLGRPRPAVAAVRAEGPSDQDLAIAAVEDAARRTGGRAPFLPLRPALPARLVLDDLAGRATGAVPATAVPFGLADEPEAQAQPADFLDLAGVDRLMVAGGPQSGRTTFARTLITSLATRFSPADVHLYVVEQFRSGLADYADLPHCGAVFSPAEPDRIRRFVGWLDQEVQRRSTALHRGASAAPRIVVVVDGWEHFEDHGNPTFIETSVVLSLREIIATGAPLGVHVVALGGHDMLSHKLPTFYSRRLLLPFPKEDTRRAHLTSKMASPPPLPGRAVDAGTGRHIQICDVALPAAELVARCRSAAEANVDAALLPRAFPSLPEEVTVDELAGSAASPASVVVPSAVFPSRTWIPLGVGGPDVATVGIDLFAGAHVLLFSGPSGSGRTTAAAAVAHGLRRVGIGVLAVAPPSSPLPGLLPADAGVRLLTGVSLKDTDLRDAAAAFGDNPYAVVVDDVSQINLIAEQEGFMDAPTLLDEVAQLSSRGRAALVLTADATPMLNGLPTPQSRLVNSAVGGGGAFVLLAPADRPTAVAHRLSLEADQYFGGPPGRGYLSFGQAPMLVQLASVGAGASADATVGAR